MYVGWPRPIGPVDKHAALPDGGAWVALTPVGKSLFFPTAPIKKRDTIILNHLNSKGQQIGDSLTILKGSVRSMATGADGNTIWVGTTEGLYRIANQQVQEVNALQSALKEISISTMTVDPSGTVWMGVDGHGQTHAKVIGYRSDTNLTDNLTTDRGLPGAQKIDSLTADPKGDLLVQAGDKLVSGAVFVPDQGVPVFVYVLAAIFTLILGA